MILTVNALTKRYGETEETIPAVDGCSFSLQKQAFIGIRGQSGCGKTTLLRLLLREITPESGKIKVGGHQLEDMKEGEIPFYSMPTLTNGLPSLRLRQVCLYP